MSQGIGRHEWMSEALCRQVGGDFWHPEDYEPTIQDLIGSQNLSATEVLSALDRLKEKPKRASRRKPYYPATVKKAKAICGQCPVQPTCLEHAITHGENHGIWGGMTPTERRKYRNA